MANNKVKVDVVVDDNGSLKQVGKKAKVAADGLDKVAKGGGQLDRNLKGVSQQAGSTAKNFSKMSQGMGGFVGVYATVAANVFALSAAFNFLKDAGDLKVLEQGQAAYAASTGIAIKTLSKDIVDATNSQISFRDASQAAAIGLSAGLNPQQLKEFGGAARDLSIILGRDVTDSFNRLIRGVTKAEPELLDELGIILRLEDATKRYAAALGKNVKDLTAFERSQAVANDVLEQANQKATAVLSDQEKLGNEIVKLGKKFEENFINPFKTGVITFLIPTIEFLSKNLLGLAGVLTLLALPITKAIIPSMEEWAKNSKEAAEKAKNSYASVKKEIKELEIAQQKLKSSADPGVAAQQALAGIKSKSTGISKIQAGNFAAVKPREISSLLAAAEKGTGAVTKMSKEMQIQYIAALRAMKAQSETTAGAIQRRFKIMGQSLKIQFKGIQAAWAIAMAGMQVAATKAAKAIDLAFKAIGWVGWILIGIDIVKAAYSKFKAFMETEEQKAARLIREGELEEVDKINVKFKALNEEIATMVSRTKELQGLSKTGFLGNLASNIDLLTLREGLEQGSEESKKILSNLAQAFRIQGKTGYANLFDDMFVEATVKGKLTHEGILNTIVQILSGLQEAGTAANALKQALKDRIDLENKLFSSLQRTTPYDTIISKYKEIVSLSKDQDLTPEEQEALDQVKTRLKIIQDLKRKELGIADDQIKNDTLREISLRNASVEQAVILESKKKEEEISDKLRAIGTDIASKRLLGLSISEEELELASLQAGLLSEQLQTQQLKTRAAEAELQAVATRNALEQRTANVGLRDKRAGGMPSLFRDQEGRAIAVERAQIALEREQELYRQQEEALGRITDKKSTLYKETQDQMALTQITIDTQAEAVRQAEANFSDVGRMGLAVGESLTSSMTSAFDGLIQGTMTAKEAFASMATSMLQSIAKIVAELLAAKLLTSALGGTSFGSFLGLPTGRYGGVMEPPSRRYGGVTQPPPGYATGGIARGSDAGYPAILHGTEAVVPLPNNRSIPVDLKGAGQQNNVTVNVSVANDGKATQDAQASSNQGANLGAAIAAAVQKELQNQKRSGGILNPYGVA